MSTLVERPIVTIQQDTPARREITPAATLIYLYDRSRDSKLGNARGQDFIAYCYDESRITFAVCDGVSQSFYGDLAARYLGTHLVDWLRGLKAYPDQIGEQADAVLRQWTDEATRLVQEKPLNSDLVPLVRDALERKRANGSEAMFVAGMLDFRQWTLAVLWMGDMRLWLWDASTQPVDLPGAAWETRERWSTRVGPKNGSPHGAVLPVERIARLTVHSDGVGSYAPDLRTITLEKLDQLALTLNATPTSDDVSILDITLGRTEVPALPVPTPVQPDQQEPVLRWEPVGGAGWYRVAINTESQQWTVDTAGTTFFVPPEVNGYAEYRVQALANESLPSKWSEPVAIARREVAPMLVAAEAVAEPELVEAGDGHGYGLMLLSALLLALILTIGWYLLYLR